MAVLENTVPPFLARLASIDGYVRTFRRVHLYPGGQMSSQVVAQFYSVGCSCTPLSPLAAFPSRRPSKPRTRISKYMHRSICAERSSGIFSPSPARRPCSSDNPCRQALVVDNEAVSQPDVQEYALYTTCQVQVAA